MKRRPLYEGHDTQNQSGANVDLTPLIDVVFILLIFFLVSAVFTQTGRIQVNLPQSGSASTENTNSPLVLHLHLDGQVSDAQGQIIAHPAAWLSQQLRTPRHVVVRPDRQCNAQTLIHLMDQCQQAGALDIAVEALSAP